MQSLKSTSDLIIDIFNQFIDPITGLCNNQFILVEYYTCSSFNTIL